MKKIFGALMIAVCIGMAMPAQAHLIKNDILDNKAGEIAFQDPIYAYWLKTEYFAK